MTDVLVLNSGFVPIRIVSDKEAICLLYQNKCYTVVETDRIMRSPSVIFKIPSVIALLYYGETPKKKVAFSKLNVIYRDDMICSYCGKRFSMKDLTIDHIIPRSRWAEVKHTNKHNFDTFENCVCACRWCNNFKGNKLLDELGWKLKRKPFEPKYIPSIIITRNRAEKKGWLKFCSFNVLII
jgi:5-methylcytosine-specific restriction endonuclease McrA